mmetsp:Transcript_124710/g.249007  ORF Transcript_124710/g.249007 Transcript_124710/m.249007 type:complete len:231 (-) Transcript_124710:1280-1972(-)
MSSPTATLRWPLGSMMSTSALTSRPDNKSSCSKTLPRFSGHNGCKRFSCDKVANASASRICCFRHWWRKSSKLQAGAKSPMPRTNSSAVKWPSRLMSTMLNSKPVSNSDSCTCASIECHSAGMRLRCPASCAAKPLKAFSTASGEFSPATDPPATDLTSGVFRPCWPFGAGFIPLLPSGGGIASSSCACFNISQMLRNRCRTFHRSSSKCKAGSERFKALSNATRLRKFL